MNNGPILRPATADDIGSIAEIWHDGWHDAHYGHVPDDLVAVRDDASFLSRSVGLLPHTTVAVVDDDVAGFVSLEGDEVDQVFVSARHRGAGVADALMAEAEARLRAAGHTSAWLAVVAGNSRARRFYERHGWTDDGPFEHLAPGPDGPIQVPAHRYIKQL